MLHINLKKREERENRQKFWPNAVVLLDTWWLSLSPYAGYQMRMRARGVEALDIYTAMRRDGALEFEILTQKPAIRSTIPPVRNILRKFPGTVHTSQFPPAPRPHQGIPAPVPHQQVQYRYREVREFFPVPVQVRATSATYIHNTVDAFENDFQLKCHIPCFL
jgi:hypothetical protein